MEQLAVNMCKITKKFCGVNANDAVDFRLRKGSIHGLLGENGAGKTTLMNVLYGLYQQEEGIIEINGKQEDISSPIKAISLGIGMVHQHFMLARPLSVVENVMLGKKSRRGILLDTKRVAEELQALSDRYHMGIDPYSKIWQLSVGEQQRVEILTAIYLGAEILILDEPTAVLTPQETEVFFNTLRQMRNDGKSIILITHKLEEIVSIVDEVTVLRAGKLIGSKLLDGTVTKDELTRMMVGRDVLFQFPPITKEPGGVRLKLENISALNDKGVQALKHFSLELHEGEIIGLAGVDGNGQKELCEVMTGLRKSTEGKMLLEGEDVSNHEPAFYIDKHISHIPEDRHSTGLALNWSLKKNMILKSIGKSPVTKHHLIQSKVVEQNWDHAQQEYQIKAKSGEEQARALSGGNQQKIILARELAIEPQVLIANQPTRGLDVGAAEYVRSRIIEARNEGTACLVVSADLEEIMQLSDRIAVIYGGELMGILPRGSDPLTTCNLWLGFLVGIITGAVYSALMAWLSVSLRVNQVIAGIGMNILATGLAAYIYRLIFGIRTLPAKITCFQGINIPILSDLPYVGTVFFQHNILVYFAFLLVPITWFILEKTTFGLKIKAVGEHPKAADSKGINVGAIRYAAVIIGGAYAGAGGVFMTIAYLNMFTESVIGGFGYIAVSVVIFAKFQPGKAMWGALLFGFASALQVRLQALGSGIPSQLLLMLPYLMTIVALIFASKKAEFPSAYTIPYSRMER